MSANELLARANRYYEQQRWADAQRAYRELIAHQESVADALYGLGMISLAARGRIGDAEQFFREALTHQPSHANSIYRLGEIAHHRGDFDSSVALFGSVLTWQPRHAGARRKLLALLTPTALSTQQTSTALPAPPRTVLHQANQTRARQPAPVPRQQGDIVGIARNVRRNKRRSGIELNFDLHIMGADHRISRTLHVTVKGQAIQGALNNGHWVEVPRNKSQITGSYVETRRVLNLTTRSEIGVVMPAYMRALIRRQTGARIPPGLRRW